MTLKCSHKQIDEIALDSPIGPTTADISLGMHSHICPFTVYKRYVDEQYLIEFSNLLSKIQQSLSAAHERENERFFDDVQTKEYRKQFTVK